MKDDFIEITPNGESEAQIAQLGSVTGSDRNGRAVEQELDEESLSKLAEKLNSEGREVLVDKDHSSEREGLERDTSAQGWASEFEFRPGKGLFGKIRWSDIGRKLVENRVFRWLSPAFRLDDRGRPVDIKSIALTNTPAQALEPVLNQKPEETEETEEFSKETEMEINLEEIAEKAAEIAFKMLEARLAEKKAEEAREEAKDEIKEEIKETVEETVMAEEPSETSQTSEVKDEVVEKKEEKEEVIKAEALNSRPTCGESVMPPESWRSLKGADFIKYIESGAWKNQG